MSHRLPREIDCKFIWGSRDLEIELHRMKDRLKQSYGINMPITVITHQLATDIREGKIDMKPVIVRRRMKKFVVVNNGTHVRV